MADADDSVPKDELKVKAKGKGKGKKGNKSKGIQRIEQYLQGTDVLYLCEVRYCQCKDRLELPFDVEIKAGKEARVAFIEYDGRHHFERILKWHKTEEDFERQKRHDIAKNRFSRDRNIPILRVAHTEKLHIEKVVQAFVLEVGKGSKKSVFHPPEMYKNPYGDEEDKCSIQ